MLLAVLWNFCQKGLWTFWRHVATEKNNQVRRSNALKNPVSFLTKRCCKFIFILIYIVLIVLYWWNDHPKIIVAKWSADASQKQGPCFTSAILKPGSFSVEFTCLVGVFMFLPQSQDRQVRPTGSSNVPCVNVFVWLLFVWFLKAELNTIHRCSLMLWICMDIYDLRWMNSATLATTVALCGDLNCLIRKGDLYVQVYCKIPP